MKAKADYYQSQIRNNIGNSKAIWKTINELTRRKSTSNSSINELKLGELSVTEPSDLCEVLNNNFTSIGTKLASDIPDGNNNFESYITRAKTIFSLEHTIKLCPYKATGLDNISCRLLKEAAPIISVSLATIINKSIDTGIFPSNWKIAKIFPLFKANDRTDQQNYRPISVLSAVSKVCERVVYDQLYAYLLKHDIFTISTNQGSIPFTLPSLLYWIPQTNGT